MNSISIILPAKNEESNLRELLPAIKYVCKDAEIIVVNDGSTDATVEVAHENGATVVSHPYSMGNGAAVKTGARHATGDILVFMDADGQHSPSDIPALLNTLDRGYGMVVGARQRSSQANPWRWIANKIYNHIASWMVEQTVLDLTSGFRVARAYLFRQFLHMLPNGFSYPTTSTMAFFRAGYSVGYVPILVRKRNGRSHIRIFKDGARFLLIIFRVGTLYSPLKLFLPVSGAFFLLGIVYYGFTFVSAGRFTNMGALLFISSVLVFLIGLVSEQITHLLYSHRRDTFRADDFARQSIYKTTQKMSNQVHTKKLMTNKKEYEEES